MTTKEKLDTITDLLNALTKRLSVVESKIEKVEIESHKHKTELKAESKATSDISTQQAESVDNRHTETESDVVNNNNSSSSGAISRSQTANTGSEPYVYAVGSTGNNVPGASHHDIH